MLDALLQDLRYALRALRSSPGFTVVAILSLALGIGANTAIFSLIDSLMLRFLPVSHPEQLRQVVIRDNGSNVTNPIWEQIRNRQDVFSSVLGYSTTRFNLAVGGEARNADGSLVSGQYFETLGVVPLLGRTITAADDKRGCGGAAVLSYEFWQKEFGGAAAILEKTVSLDSHRFPVVGVIRPGFYGTTVGSKVDVFLPICAEAVLRGEVSALDRRSTWWINVIGRPKPGMDERQVDARLRILAPDIFAATVPTNWNGERQREFLSRTFDTVSAAKGLSYLRQDYRAALITLMVVVGVVLLIACANVANLLLARAAMRQREIAIRMAIGAGRGRLIRQLLTESLILSFGGAGLGILFAQWGSRLLVGFLSGRGGEVTLDLSIDGRVLGFTIAIAVLTGVLFGLAPAWRGTRVDPQSAMKSNARGLVEGQSKFGLGKALVMVQVALSLVLLVGAGLMLNTFTRLSTQDAGFERDHVLLVSVDLRNANFPKDRRAGVYKEMQVRLRAIPGVRSVSYSNITPVSGGSSNQRIYVDGYVAKSPRDSVVWVNTVSQSFFETLGTAFIAGRDFNDRDVLSAPLVSIINESMANKFFGGAAAALGRTFKAGLTSDEKPIEIVGVVKDSRYRSLREANETVAYFPQLQDENPGAVQELRTARFRLCCCTDPGGESGVRRGESRHLSAFPNNGGSGGRDYVP